MLIYTNTIQGFNNDVLNGIIAEKIEQRFYDIGINHNNAREFRSWDNSLAYMQIILNDREIGNDINIAIEFQIPQTSKRVDFLITGKDESNRNHVVIIELKQWEKAERTSREDIVTTFIGGSIHATTHPSYQAYSYAKTIENFNEAFQIEEIELHPCAYLHNYGEEHRAEIDNDLYKNIIEIAPIYLKKDGQKLRDFIKRFIKNTDSGDLLYKIENGKIRPSKVLQDSLVSMLNGNSEFVMLDEQKVVYSTIKKLVNVAVAQNKKFTVIVEGGPGTGKSVIAVNLLVGLRHLNVNYVTKNAAPRNVYFHKLRRGNYRLSFINSLFKGSGSYIDVQNDLFDCLLIDEAHRLNEKSGMFQNMGENQIKELIKSSKVSVFFIDEDQVVTTKDIGSINEIKKWANMCGSTIIDGDDYKLTSQFRCNGSDGYISFLDHILGIRETANYDGFDLEYDFKIFDCPNKMRLALQEKNINNKARMIAGYCYNWISKNTPKSDDYDIQLINEFKAKWNFGNTNLWAIDEDSFNQVGCIHTSQGLEFDYVGVIIGKDLSYEGGKVITDKTKRAKTDQSLRGLNNKDNPNLADRIIRNTYKTLLSRGQKGCYVFCEDTNLSDYLKLKLKNSKYDVN